jgi:hypothetical protein
MPHLRPAALALASVVVLLLAVPTGALAAQSVVVTGTVLRDGAPVTGVDVVVSVTGTDLIVSTATDESGEFTVAVEAGVGSELQVYATGRTSRSDPDRNGCITFETPIGQLTAVIAEVPPPPLSVNLDTVLTSTVCGATATPGVTPPSTDVAGPTPPGGAGHGLLLVLGVLALAGGGALTIVPRRR